VTSRPHVNRIVETALDSPDLAGTSAFYEALLDTEPMVTGGRLVAFDAGGGTVLLLFQWGATARAVKTPGGTVPGHVSGGPGHVAFAVDPGDAPSWESRLADLGITIESRVEWKRGGVSIYFRDPDHRLVELATPGLWPSF